MFELQLGSEWATKLLRSQFYFNLIKPINYIAYDMEDQKFIGSMVGMGN